MLLLTLDFDENNQIHYILKLVFFILTLMLYKFWLKYFSNKKTVIGSEVKAIWTYKVKEQSLILKSMFAAMSQKVMPILRPIVVATLSGLKT